MFYLLEDELLLAELDAECEPPPPPEKLDELNELLDELYELPEEEPTLREEVLELFSLLRAAVFAG